MDTTVFPVAEAAVQGTLILDRLGRILSCGDPVARLLGVRPTRLLGRPISDFVLGLFPEGATPSFATRYLGYLCKAGEWREFAGRDGAGHPIQIEVNLARLATDNPEREIFLLSMRNGTAGRNPCTMPMERFQFGGNQ